MSNEIQVFINRVSMWINKKSKQSKHQYDG